MSNILGHISWDNLAFQLHKGLAQIFTIKIPKISQNSFVFFQLFLLCSLHFLDEQAINNIIPESYSLQSCFVFSKGQLFTVCIKQQGGEQEK